MKVLVATMSHETNTFSPVPTHLERFGNGKPPLEGLAAYNAIKGLGITMAGLIHGIETYAEKNGIAIEVITAIAADAPPSGPVDNNAYQYICDTICTNADGCDGILLSLHGAMVTDQFEDGEGRLLARLRRENPGIPIGVGLDMHANVYAEMVDNATVIAGFQTYPHIDMFETGERVATTLLKVMCEHKQMTMAWGNCPMLPHVMRQGTDDQPNKALQLYAQKLEQEEAVLVSLFTGFPHADIVNAGLSVIVVTDNAPEKANRIRDKLLTMAWQAREAFVYKHVNLDDSISQAITLATSPNKGPIILLDHYDNSASGGTMDTTEVLREVINRQLEDVAAFGIFDPTAVAKLIDVGMGKRTAISIGANLPMPALQQQSQPLEVVGEVTHISAGRFKVTGEMGKGTTMNMGDTVVFDTGQVQIVIISRHIEPYDLGCFTSLGIDPLKKQFIMLKSRIHYRSSFLPICKAVVECAGLGVCTSDYEQLNFKQVRRPIFPLDSIEEVKWSP